MPKKTGNPATMGCNAATMMPSGPGSACEKMGVMNTELRGALAGDKSSKTISDAFGPTGATTVAHGSLSGGGVTAAASRLLPSRYKNMAQGIWKEKNKKKRRAKRKSGKSNLCPKPAFTYDQAFRPHQSHCESKILEDLFQSPAGLAGQTLTLNINWQASGVVSNQPCLACERVLCHAQEHCELNIELCEKNAKKGAKPLEC